ncbi:MAG TPA: hypothetical protein VJB90_00895 [Candidatus Nanoarchaeia archaeon]|nr:hypothetical protein [Candidatus Nanoarchaeia archaeon]
MKAIKMPIVLVLLAAIMIAYFNIAKFIPFLSNIWIAIIFALIVGVALFVLAGRWMRER